MYTYQVNHTTRYYYYNTLVSISHHAAKLLPRNVPHQRCLSSELYITPSPSILHESPDYFGNRSTHFTITEPHNTLSVTSSFRIEIDPVLPPNPASTNPWEKVKLLFESPLVDQFLLEVYHYLFPSPHIPYVAGISQYAKESFPTGRPIAECALDLTRRIHQDFIFDPTATQVSTPLWDVLQNKRGVCQDFAHFQIACFRSMGLPSRYVSGYLRTIPPPGMQRMRGADASHAWLQVYCPGYGWLDLDPTNNVIPGNFHITIAWGRDYSDVCPLLGVTYGGESQTLEVSVDVEQENG